MNNQKTILLINGSPHNNGQTATALKQMEKIFCEKGIKTAWFWIGNKPVRGCIACEQCTGKSRCVFNDDGANALIEAIKQSNGIIIGTPVYFAGVNGALCAILDRVFYAGATKGRLFDGKPAAAITTSLRSGSVSSFDRLNHYFTFAGMPIVSSIYWNNIIGKEDNFGKNVIDTLANRMVEILNKLN